MYDHPPSPLASVVALSTTKINRSHSPIPHISTLIPSHHYHSNSNQYSPNTRQADISRLLDPAYATTSDGGAASSSRSTLNTRFSRQETVAYVDHHGDLHDPDYRDFPVLPPSKRQQQQQQKAKRQRRSASAHSTLYTNRLSGATVASTRHDRYSGYPLVARPEWERDWATEIEDLNEDDDDYDADSWNVHSPFSPRSSSSSSSSRTPASRRASLPPSIYTHSSFYYSEPSTMTTSAGSSPVGSLEETEEEGVMETHVGDADVPVSGVSPSRRRSLLRHMKRNSSQCSTPVVEMVTHQEKQEEMDTHLADEDPFLSSSRRGDATTAPSCSRGLRQHWQAFSLRLRFGLYNAKRRLSSSGRQRKAV